MRVSVPWGLHNLKLDLAPGQLIGSHRGSVARPLEDLAAAVRQALDQPADFPALHLALTPDDHVAIVVDEEVPRLAEVLVAVMEELERGAITPDAVTLVCLAPSSGQPWLEDLPKKYQEVHVEVHQPSDRRCLSYLARTEGGRRIYLNRTVVDADLTVLISRRGYDAFLGVSGAEGFLFPALSDEATQQEMRRRISVAPPGDEHEEVREEATEVAWLLGTPFLLQFIAGSENDVLNVVGGTMKTTGIGHSLLDASWRLEVDELADIVIAGVGGDPARHQIIDLARGFLCAARVVKPGGRIILLSDAAPELGPSGDILRNQEDPVATLRTLLYENPYDVQAGFLWASAALRAQLYLLSKLPAEIAEEMFAIPIKDAAQVADLIKPGVKCLIIPDAHKTLAVVAS